MSEGEGGGAGFHPPDERPVPEEGAPPGGDRPAPYGAPWGHGTAGPGGGPPPYGGAHPPYGAQGTGPAASGHPGVRAGDLRPRRWWFAVAAVIAVAGVVTAIVMFVGILAGGTPDRTFAAGETVTVHLKRDPRPGFFVSDGGSPDDRCYAQAADGRRIAAEPISGSMTVTVNGRRWHVLSRLRLPADGTYQVTCTPSYSGVGARYGVGTPPDVASFFLVVLIPIASIGVAIVIAIVIAVRRGSHRRRLLAPPPAAGW